MIVFFDLWEWSLNLLILSMGLVGLSVVGFLVCLIIYSIHDWRGK